ncbi:hypothetical protein PIIN_00426 [Serendipita indica DSM 11827]|uniref:Uncharacterized protein n=1 Tax=Serendipita indica (strain DSM 11827) TaxID=1109443 RepID=G4T621_SERID|nr:hypothetical protein PIIN_00426 [Serendipita indica DSM 11827]
MESRKMFLAFLALSSLTVFALVLPVGPILWQHTVTAYYASQHDKLAHALWWDQWYSWVLFAGPLGRLPVGVVFGFRLLRLQRGPNTTKSLGSMISEPSLTIFIVVQIALCLALFTMALLILGIRDVLQGHTTFDRIIGPRGKLYWIPADDDDTLSEGEVIACPSGVNAYDLGWQRNWADLVARPLIGTVCLDRDVIPVVNATTVLHEKAQLTGIGMCAIPVPHGHPIPPFATNGRVAIRAQRLGYGA